MAISQVPSQHTHRLRDVHRTEYPAQLDREMKKRIEEGSDFGAFVHEWKRLMGPILGMSLVLNCSDQAVRSWFRKGNIPSAACRALMRQVTPKMGRLPDKAWARSKSWEIPAHLNAN